MVGAGSDPTETELDAAVEEWADSEGVYTLAEWLMAEFGWTQERADEEVDRYGIQ